MEGSIQQTEKEKMEVKTGNKKKERGKRKTHVGHGNDRIRITISSSGVCPRFCAVCGIQLGKNHIFGTTCSHAQERICSVETQSTHVNIA
jgi:hypothetical protein